MIGTSGLALTPAPSSEFKPTDSGQEKQGKTGIKTTEPGTLRQDRDGTDQPDR